MPSVAPLANPYVPFQIENPPKYEASKGFIRGTLFPGLDLPFMGQELALYLDTHREDKEALELYQSYQRLYHDCMMRYTKDYGPLNHGTPTEGPYSWLDDPWPWEYCGNKEA